MARPLLLELDVAHPLAQVLGFVAQGRDVFLQLGQALKHGRVDGLRFGSRSEVQRGGEEILERLLDELADTDIASLGGDVELVFEGVGKGDGDSSHVAPSYADSYFSHTSCRRWFIPGMIGFRSVQAQLMMLLIRNRSGPLTGLS